jgi:hypothetical protein
MSFKKISFALFLIIAGLMAGLFFSVPLLAKQPQNMLIWICTGAGLLIFLILSLVVYGLGKAPAEKKAQPATEPAKAQFDKKAVQVLSLLQKKGRLIDFLQEDISGYEDGQIGAAVRNIHKGCKEAVEEYITIEPIMQETEGSDITVEKGFDPSVIRLTGNVTGEPPFKGVLRHSGWHVSSSSLPVLPDNQDLSVIEPAEVEMN